MRGFPQLKKTLNYTHTHTHTTCAHTYTHAYAHVYAHGHTLVLFQPMCQFHVSRYLMDPLRHMISRIKTIFGVNEWVKEEGRSC